MKTFITATVLALGLTVAVPVTATDIPTDADTVAVDAVTVPPCDEEDGTVTSAGVAVPSCYWDATTRGNGTGHSFVAVRE